MRKLKRFILNQNRQLTAIEMAELNGGDLTLKCHREYEACGVISGETVLEGTCVYDPLNPAEMVCNTSKKPQN